jgi:hypothetical protein
MDNEEPPKNLFETLVPMLPLPMDFDALTVHADGSITFCKEGRPAMVLSPPASHLPGTDWTYKALGWVFPTFPRL